MPQGLGFLHFTPKPLSNEEAISIVNEPHSSYSKVKLSMDYVSGRACKMTVFEKDGKLFINDSWYDHTDEQFQELLNAFDIKATPNTEHSCACNCLNCQAKQK